MDKSKDQEGKLEPMSFSHYLQPEAMGDPQENLASFYHHRATHTHTVQRMERLKEQIWSELMGCPKPSR